MILVLRALGLGDLLTAVPAVRALRRAYPREDPAHRLVLAAPRPLAPLAHLAGGVDAVAGTAGLGQPIGLPRASAPPVVAVNLHGSGPESHRRLAATGPARLVAFGDAASGHRGPRWCAHEHEVRRWCRLLEESGIPADAGDLDVRRPGVPAPAGARGAVVIHPGAASGARRWPARRWASVAAELAAGGDRVVLTGGPHEVRLAREVAERAQLHASAVLAGRTGILELAAVVADARAVVSGDTGVAHLATALRTPSVVLFGPVPPAHWGPPPDRPWHRALWAGTAGDPHGSAPDPGLLRIGVEEVLAALGDLPGATAA